MADPQATEVRIALACNGGVSLAIWIGGVADELLRCVNAGRRIFAGRPDPKNPYTRLCEDLNVVPLVDVITGASAGGLNSVFLALGLVQQHQTLTRLRDLWVSDGAFERLLRGPTDARTPSLMRGDEYFLPRIEHAVERLLKEGTPRSMSGERREPPVHVRLTATSLEGRVLRLPDAAGDVLYSTDHHAEFRFGEEDFNPTDESIGTTARRLARACRSTASFPGAFEPSLDDWKAFGPTIRHVQGMDHLVDGGVLVNLPATQAIDAIAAQPSRERVHRVLALVVPDPGKPVLPLWLPLPPRPERGP